MELRNVEEVHNFYFYFFVDEMKIQRELSDDPMVISFGLKKTLEEEITK